MLFQDRVDAGNQLADLAVKKVSGKGVVLGIPRGGVVVAKIVADRLGWPIRAIHAKKIGAAFNPELAVSAEVKPPFPKLAGVKQVVVVDDGVATGHTLEAAINYLRRQSSKVRVIAALPVAAKDSAHRLKKLVDRWLCLFEPEDLEAVGQYYLNFEQ